MFDVFLSYAHADREAALALRDELVARNLAVWLDDDAIDTFDSIGGSIERGLARSKALVALYTRAYPARRACQWELTAAFVAAGKRGDPRQRVLVVNPEPSTEHVLPLELRDALHARGSAEAADAVAAHVATLAGELGDLGVSERPLWLGRRPLGGTRFVGRWVDMWRIHSALHAVDAPLVSGARGEALAVVTGVGGIGKSQLVAEYALRFAGAHPGGVFWLRALGHDDTAGGPAGPADRVAERDRQLLAFAAELGLDASDLAPRRLAGALGRELDSRGKSFLWIVEDLPGDVTASELDGWLAPGRLGRTLATTRSRTRDLAGTRIDLGVLDEDDGVELLSRHRPPDGPQELAAARRLVADLGGHPLALDVAGATLGAERGVRSFARYQADLSGLGADELKRSRRHAGELRAGGLEPSVASTLARSIAGLDQLGMDFLRLAALLAVGPIPASVVVDAFAIVDDLEIEAARERAVSAMEDVAARSLAETLGEGGARQVHTLVSQAVRLVDRDRDRVAALAAAAVQALTQQLWHGAPIRVAAPADTLAHARHVAGEPADEAQAMLLAWAAHHDRFRGDERSAIALDERVVEARRRLLGAEHPETLLAMNNLAVGLGNIGEVKRAHELLARVLEAQERVLGPEHPQTLMSRNARAVVLCETGDLEGARDLHERTLAALQRVLGDEHPETLISMNNLAEVLRELGDRVGAYALAERAAYTARRVLGSRHPRTLTLNSTLAATLHAGGELPAAIELYEQVLEARLTLLGEEHLETLVTMSNLGGARRDAGDLEAARELQERVLETARRTLSDGHQLTLSAMNGLALIAQETGDTVAARAAMERLVDMKSRVRGPDHPNTLSSRLSLGMMLHAQGDLDRARALIERVVEDCERVLGREHPDSLHATYGLAEVVSDLGDLQAARTLYARALQRAVRLYGESNPGTVEARNKLEAIIAKLADA